MGKRIEAFKLTGRVEIEARKAKQDLKSVEADAKRTKGVLGGLRGALSGGGGGAAAGGLLSFAGEALKMLPGLGLVAGGIGRVTDAITGGIKVGFDYNKLLEENTIAFEKLLGGADAAQAHLRDLAKFGETSPFEFPELVGASKKMLAMGFSVGEILPTLRAVSDASSTLGADMDSIIRALGQMRSKGKASAEEMNGQLAEQGIPAWRYLAEAVAKTDKAFARLTSDQQIARLQKLTEQGKISGRGASDAILAGLQREFGGLGERVANETATGMEANLSDVTSRLAGTALKPSFEKYKQTLGGLLQIANSETAASLARGTASGTDAIFGALGTVAADFKSIGFNITAGLSGGIAESSGAAVEAAKTLGDGVISAAKDVLDINSPSGEFIAIGEFIGEGLEIGLNRSQAKVYAAMRRLFEKEPEFLPKLIRESIKRGINPDELLNVMAVETGGTFNPRAKNPLSSATGLIQFMEETVDGKNGRGGIGRSVGITHDMIRSLSATEQLDLVFAYFDQKKFRGKLGTQAALYSAVGTGQAGGDDSQVRFTRADGDKYRLNAPTWDRDKDGVIRQGELGAAAQAKLGAGKFFTVNGGELSRSNPMPVTVVESRDERRSRLGLDDAPVYRAAKRDPFAAPAPAASRSPRALDAGVTDRAFEPAVRNVRTVHEILEDMRNRPIRPEDIMPVQIGTESSLVLHKLEQIPPALDAAASSAQKLNTTIAQTTPIIVAAEAKVRESALTWASAAQGFEQIFGAALTNTEGTFGDWIKGIGYEFANMLRDMAAQELAYQAASFLFGKKNTNGSGGGGGGGALGSLFGSLGSLFGGFRAEGGGVARGRSYIVGENGPELYTPGANGFVTPNHMLGSGGGGGAPGKVELAIRNVTVLDPKHVTDAMMSSSGEHVTLAHIDRNISQIAEKVSRYIR